MGHIAHDSVDHASGQAGEMIINTRTLPGLMLIALTMLALAVSLYLLGDGDLRDGIASAFVTAAVGTAGVLWILGAHRRIVRLERRWLSEHPGHRQ